MACSEHPGLNLRVARVVLFLVCCATFCWAPAAGAEGIHGYVQFDYNNAAVKTTDPTGVTTKSDSNAFLQRYNLSLENALYPSLVVSGGGIFENSTSWGDTNGNSSTGSATQISPFASISLLNPFFPTAAGYHRREERSESNGVASPTRIMETYDGRIALKPEGLPPVNFSYSRTHLYDDQRQFTDTTTENYLWGTSYQPTPKADLSYQGAYTVSSNALNHLSSEIFSHNGRAAYADQFFHNRVSFATNYNLAVSSTTVSSTGSGDVFVPVNVLNSANGALSATTSPTSVPPLLVTNGQLSATPALLVGSANFNLVTATPQLPGPQTNLGLDFGRPVSVNTIYLTLISGTNQRPEALGKIATINQLFPWSVYTSDDGINWVQRAGGVTGQQFGPDPSGGSDTVGFILSLNIPSTRFVKVVNPADASIRQVAVSDLLPFSPIFQDGSNQLSISSIAVSRMQAFLRQPASSFAGGTTSSVAGQLGLNLTAQLLDTPHLVYDFGFGLTHSSGGDTTQITYYINNGLSADYQFNSALSGNARISVQQNQNAAGPLVTNLGYTAGLSIASLSTLTHNLVYSGNISNVGDPQSTTSNSIFVTNTAQLYKGVALGVSGGYSTSTQPGGGQSQSVILSSGLSLIPRKDLNVNLGYSETSTQQSGGVVPSSSTYTRSGALSVSYTPFETLYLTGAWAISASNDQPTTTTQNYGASWSPFRGGTLQFNFNYSESLSSPDNQKTRSLSPSARWNVRPGTTVDFTYQYFTISGPSSGETVGNTLAATLRIAI